MEHFTRGLPLIEGGAEEADETACGDDDSEIVAQIKELIETRVRPAVAQDGGDIIFKGFDDKAGIVFLHMRGLLRGLSVLDHDAEERDREYAAPLRSRGERGRSGLISTPFLRFSQGIDSPEGAHRDPRHQ